MPATERLIATKSYRFAEGHVGPGDPFLATPEEAKLLLAIGRAVRDTSDAEPMPVPSSAPALVPAAARVPVPPAAVAPPRTPPTEQVASRVEQPAAAGTHEQGSAPGASTAADTGKDEVADAAVQAEVANPAAGQAAPPDDTANASGDPVGALTTAATGGTKRTRRATS